ncbi:hypothetical protein [Siphoviridae environmental samples]|nr:hypothetical protein [Siphoviridae environmental samples]
MSKHTPGPWTWNEDFEGLLGASDADVLHYADYEGMWLSDYKGCRQANARLIAAAPELLENLMGCMEALASYAPDCIEVQCARAAIAKAEGK